MSVEEKKAAFQKVKTQLQEAISFLDKWQEDYPEVYAEMDKLRTENQKMKSDLDHVSKELEKVSKEFQHLTKEKDAKVEIREILSLSMTLLVDVFGAMPHSKLLYLLHGQKSEMTRDALAKSSGISAAMVRKALADLASAKLLEYDVESGEVKLLKRIY